ncbi:MAG: formylglycine-generating enzyme family protein [Kiritimatiellae bacterium]|nr:formylglycine-generating enzyme family protein [Kiritimatiellia bacterium]
MRTSDWTKRLAGMAVAVLAAVCAFADPQIRNVTARQRFPWNGKVDISYEVVGSVPAGTPLKVVAMDKTGERMYEAVSSALSGELATDEGVHKVVWDLTAQGIKFQSQNVVFRVYGTLLYCVIDLSGGASASNYPVTYLASPPGGGFNVDAYKTTKLVLRRIEAGTFVMGYDQTDESRRVMLTKPFYIGLFEVTQKQYELVMGSNPSSNTGDKRPVEKVSYNMIRGTSNGANWPSSSAVDTTSFLGKFRARTGLEFDLPTEAQWEYACRAGTTSDYNNGGGSESDLKLVGRYLSNPSDGKGGYSTAHTTVGSYLPNAWGLYDMHGNVWEWSLDRYGTLAYGTDPKGSSSGAIRVRRGGSWDAPVSYCTSSSRLDISPSTEQRDIGFRLARTLSE